MLGALIGLLATELMTYAQSPQRESTDLTLVESDEFNDLRDEGFDEGWILVDKDADVFAYINDPRQTFIPALSAPGTTAVWVSLTKYSVADYYEGDHTRDTIGIDDFLDSLQVIVVRDVEWDEESVSSGNLLDRVTEEIEAAYPYIEGAVPSG